MLHCLSREGIMYCRRIIGVERESPCIAVWVGESVVCRWGCSIAYQERITLHRTETITLNRWCAEGIVCRSIAHWERITLHRIKRITLHCIEEEIVCGRQIGGAERGSCCIAGVIYYSQLKNTTRVLLYCTRWSLAWLIGWLVGWEISSGAHGLKVKDLPSLIAPRNTVLY